MTPLVFLIIQGFHDQKFSVFRIWNMSEDKKIRIINMNLAFENIGKCKVRPLYSRMEQIMFVKDTL